MSIRKPSKIYVITGIATALILSAGFYLMTRHGQDGGSSSTVATLNDSESVKMTRAFDPFAKDGARKLWIESAPTSSSNGLPNFVLNGATQTNDDPLAHPGFVETPSSGDRTADQGTRIPASADGTVGLSKALNVGTTVDPGANANLGVTQIPAEPVTPPAPGCFTVSYTHKATSGHDNADECSHHRNRLKLPVAGINHKAVCVRVDGTPVHFDWMKDSILIGAIAGPKSKISVRYCLEKEKCAEDCSIPKDEFMAALGGDDEHIARQGAKAGKAAKWDPSDSHDDSDVSAKIDAEMQRELAGGIDLALFEGWKDSDPAPACEHHASQGKLVSVRK